MDLRNFEQIMEYFGYPVGDKKYDALRLVMVYGMSQSAASQLVGYHLTQLNTVYSRVRRELKRIRTLTGVDLLKGKA